MLKEFSKYARPIFIFVPLLGLVHFLCARSFPKLTSTFFSIWELYLFLGFITLAGLLALIFVKNKDESKVGMAFAAFGGIKMLMSILFLLPIFLSKTEGAMNAVLIFFVPYFIVLILDVFTSLKLLNSQTTPT